MSDKVTQKGHPKGLYVLFITEMWERFSYYGMRAIFILYMGKALLFDKALSSQIYGSYTGLVYLTPLIGGYIADRYWGNRRSIITGGFLMAIGQFMMFASASMYTNVSLASTLMIIALIFMIIGNGFFKPNISTMVGQLYPKGDKRVDAAFTIFYMGINLGAFIAPLVCGGLAGSGDDPSGFKWGFFAAGIGMILSTLLFIWLKNFYIVTPEGEQIGERPNKAREVQAVNSIGEVDSLEEIKKEFPVKLFVIWGSVAVVLFCTFFLIVKFDLIGSSIFSLAIAVPGLIISDPSLSKIEKERIWVIFIACFFVIFFWSAFEQAGASLTFFADEKTNRDLGLIVSQTMARGIIGILIALVAYILFWVFKKVQNEKPLLKELMMVLLLGAIGYGVYLFFAITPTGLDLREIPASFFQSINAIAIVIFAPLFAWLWTKLGSRNMEPASPFKQALGLFLLAIGYLVIAFGVKGLMPGVKVSMMWLIALYTIHTFGELCLSPIGLSMVNKLAPVKFASLLMGVWFLANATANKFAGQLSSLYPEQMISTELVAEVKSTFNLDILKPNVKGEDFKGTKAYTLEMVDYSKIDDKEVRKNVVTLLETKGMNKEKAFLGFNIKNLYDFFMIFVFMAGIASVILFFVSRKLVKMMNGIR
jgi:POT family proton-dependent oligopeptide transporter